MFLGTRKRLMLSDDDSDQILDAGLILSLSQVLNNSLSLIELITLKVSIYIFFMEIQN
jgi:hypothetical protein